MDTCLYNYVVLSYVNAYVHKYRNKDRKQDGSLIMATLLSQSACAVNAFGEYFWLDSNMPNLIQLSPDCLSNCRGILSV